MGFIYNQKPTIMLEFLESLEVLTIVLGGLIVLYETLSRVVPTSKTWSIIGNVLRVLMRISQALDNNKKSTR